jgi:PilZ domain
VEESPIGNTTPEATGESQRRDQRDSLFVLAKLRPEGDTGQGDTVRVRNVSSGGLMADASDHYRPGARVEIELEGIGTMGGSVAWSEAGRIGIAFDHPIDKARAR